MFTLIFGLVHRWKKYKNSVRWDIHEIEEIQIKRICFILNFFHSMNISSKHYKKSSELKWCLSGEVLNVFNRNQTEAIYLKLNCCSINIDFIIIKSMSISNQNTNQVVGLYPLSSQTQCGSPRIKQYLTGPNLNQHKSNPTLKPFCPCPTQKDQANFCLSYKLNCHILGRYFYRVFNTGTSMFLFVHYTYIIWDELTVM